MAFCFGHHRLADADIIQDLSYVYDDVGNITEIDDDSATGLAKTTAYVYDDLHRLTSASTTVASNTPYRQSYTYSPIGNITGFATTTGATSTYTYAETDSTNPHAVTSIGSSTLVYDTNGNLTSYGSSTYAWDYRNRLTSVSPGSTSYAYDHTTNRVKKTVGATSTIYASDLYNTDGTTKTKSIFAGGDLVATVETVGATSTIRYVHADHLGSTNAVTNASGTLVQTLDNYPYGAKRIDVGTDVSQREFIGEFFDQEADLSYLNARYYSGVNGKFISQDPMFWSLPQELLSDPQQMNAYSYGRNNPIVNKDPTGLFILKSGTVEKGDTLGKITSILNKANKTNYSVSQVAGLNGISNPDRIYAGQTLKPNSSVPDVSSRLNSLNQTRGSAAAAKISTDAKGNTSITPGISNGEFAWNFRQGGPWDLKSQEGVFCQQGSCGGQTAENYIFNAQEILGDAPGNIHYGYVGKQAGYSIDTLQFFGHAVQLVGRGHTPDPLQDQRSIYQGYNLSYPR